MTAHVHFIDFNILKSGSDDTCFVLARIAQKGFPDDSEVIESWGVDFIGSEAEFFKCYTQSIIRLRECGAIECHGYYGAIPILRLLARRFVEAAPLTAENLRRFGINEYRWNGRNADLLSEKTGEPKSSPPFGGFSRRIEDGTDILRMVNEFRIVSQAADEKDGLQGFRLWHTLPDAKSDSTPVQGFTLKEEPPTEDANSCCY